MAGPYAPSMRRLLIGTDTESDDAVAVLMALRHPAIQIEALTVVGGNVGLDQAVQNALYTVELSGADVIVDTILGSPGEITLVTLGPLTNVAIAAQRAPEIVDAVAWVVVMGGTGVNGPGNVSAMAEYNVWADSEAAQIVVRSGLPLELVGWDSSLALVDAERHARMQAMGSGYSEVAVDIARVVRRFAIGRVTGR